MINLSFESYEEMQGFAKKLLIGSDQDQPAQTVVVEPVGISAPVQTVPVTQQPTAPVVNPVPQVSPVNVVPQTAAETVAPAQVQVSTTAYALEDIAKAAMTLMDAGKQTQLQELLAGYGVGSLPELPKEQYGNFATALRGLGAAI